jgi:uncharacterized membrane protein
MAFCPNCGAQATGTFCPNCGTAIGAGGASTSAGRGTTGSASSAGYVPPAQAIQAPGLTENVASALCYLFGLITGIIFLVISPYNTNKTVRFHAFQSIFASIAVIIGSIILSIITGMLFFAHGWWLGYFIRRLYDLLVFLGWLYMMYTAYTNKKVLLPVVGPLAQKQA